MGAFTGNFFDSDGFGLVTAAESLGNIPAGASFFIRNDGVVFVGGVSTAKSIDYPVGAVVGLAIDLDNQRAWARNSNKLGNAWIGQSGAADPVTNTNGFNISGVFSGLAVYLCLATDNSVTDIVTIKDVFDYTAPAGFDPW